MEIYLGHSSSLEYEEKLYQPLKNSKLADLHEFVFPHDNSSELFDSREFLRNDADLMIAEVSNPSTGLGIELGWADSFDVEIIFLAKEGCSVSSSIEALNSDILRYSDEQELIEFLAEFLD